MMQPWWQRNTIHGRVEVVLLWVLAMLMAGMFVLWATAGWAQAEWYVAGDLLQARYQGPQVDGTWRQDHVPGNHMTLESMAWDVGR